MDASTFLELQEAWLHADQLGSPAYSFSALQPSARVEKPFSLRTPDMYLLDAIAGSETEEALQSMGYREENGLLMGNTKENALMMGNTEEDALMMDRPFLDYLNDMLMDEAMEERPFLPQDCMTYQSIVKSFYSIVDERSTCVQSSSSSDNFNNDDIASVSIPASSTSDGLGVDSATFTSMLSGENVRIYDENPGKPSTPMQSSFNSFDLSDTSFAPTNMSYSGVVDNGYGWIEHNLFSRPNHATPFPAAHGEFNEGHISFVKNNDLNVEADYQRLYLNKNQNKRSGRVVDDKSNGLADEDQHNGHAQNKSYSRQEIDKSRNGRVGVKGKKGHTKGAPIKHMDAIDKKLEAGVALDLRELLVSCAQAVSVGNATRAFDMLQQLRKNGASPNGSGLHRVIHYFCEALEARMHGAGNRVYADAAYNNRPSAAKLLKAFRTAISFIPMLKFAHYFANQSILKAAEGATRLHIIDYGSFYGLQWPCLINALADRKGGPPMLVITGIEYPQPGVNPAEGLEDIGHRLSEYATTYNVPFEYRAIAASNWEVVDPLPHNTGDRQEVVVVNCMHRLRHVLDESIGASDNSTSCHRQRLLEKMCKLKPDLFVVAVVNATHNSPFFVSRFREALNYYCSKFDMVDTTWDSSSDRMIMEKDCFYRDILNVVACEGFERVERPETYKQWQARIQRAGFEQMQVMPDVLARSRAHVQNYYHKDFNVDHASNRWMLVSWKGRTTEAMSAWKPRGMHT